MKNKRKKSQFKRQNVDYSFNSKRLTLFSGLAPIMKFINKTGLFEQFKNNLKTIMSNATKFQNSQLMMSVVISNAVWCHKIKQNFHIYLGRARTCVVRFVSRS